jgi:hypothetical protein
VEVRDGFVRASLKANPGTELMVMVASSLMMAVVRVRGKATPGVGTVVVVICPVEVTVD